MNKKKIIIIIIFIKTGKKNSIGIYKQNISTCRRTPGKNFRKKERQTTQTGQNHQNDIINKKRLISI